METFKAVCECKKLSEDELVVPIKRKPFSGWGIGLWSINLLLVIVTAGGYLPFLGGFIFVKFFINDTEYECQYCRDLLKKENYR